MPRDWLHNLCAWDRHAPRRWHKPFWYLYFAPINDVLKTVTRELPFERLPIRERDGGVVRIIKHDLVLSVDSPAHVEGSA